MVTYREIRAYVRAEVGRATRRISAKLKKKPPKLYTFSHMVMGGVMMMFFVGVALGVFVTVTGTGDLTVTLDFIMELARIVCLGYFIKAFGENIAKIVLSAVFGNRIPDTPDEPATGAEPGIENTDAGGGAVG